MTDNFKEIGSLFGREGAGVGFAKQTDKESFTYIQNEGGAPLPADALGTPEEQGIRAMLIATGEAPREVTLLPDKVGFDPETGESRSLTDGETARVEGYFTVISRPGSGAKAVDDIRHGITPGSYDISVESHDCTSGRNALAADAPARDAPGKDNQNIG